MRKLLVALFLIGFVGVSRAGDWGPESNLVPTGLNHTSFLSSGTVWGSILGPNNTAGITNQAQFTGGTIYKVLCSTGADNPEWFQLFELNQSSPAGGFAYTSLNFASMTVTPPIVLRSSNTAVSVSGAILNGIDYSPYGIITSTGTYFYYGGGVAIGERTCTVYWKK